MYHSLHCARMLANGMEKVRPLAWSLFFCPLKIRKGVVYGTHFCFYLGGMDLVQLIRELRLRFGLTSFRTLDVLLQTRIRAQQNTSVCKVVAGTTFEKTGIPSTLNSYSPHTVLSRNRTIHNANTQPCDLATNSTHLIPQAPITAS
jgi:hypothetical protein